MSFDYDSNVLVEDVVVYSAAGMGLTSFQTSGITLRRVKVCHGWLSGLGFDVDVIPSYCRYVSHHKAASSLPVVLLRFGCGKVARAAPTPLRDRGPVGDGFA